MPAARPALLAAAFAAGLNCTPQPALRPSIDPARMDPWGAVTRYLDSAVAAGAAPGAVLGVSHHGRRFVYGTGRLGTDDPARPDSATVYDLASLTKVIGLTTMVMLAVDEGRLDLDAPVQQYVPAFRGTNKQLVTLRHLLTHSSGLPAWRPLYQETGTRAAALALADTTPLDTLPGARYLYSDLGAIVLTQAVEAVYGTRLDSLLADRVFGPLGMSSTRYLPPASWLPRIAPTENDPWRGRVVRGEVHDENAFRLDGVSGHAGLFSTVPDLLRFGEWLLLADRRAGGPAAGSTPITPATVASLHGETVREFLRRQDLPPGSSRALGWDTPSPNSSAGTRLSEASFGHTGFTGTSIWIDPEQDLVIVLLTNRVNPTRENRKIYAVRRGVADRVVEEVEREK